MRDSRASVSPEPQTGVFVGISSNDYYAAAVARPDDARRVRVHRKRAEHRREPALVLPGSAGPEHGGRHRVSLVARRRPSGVRELAPRRVRHGARGRRESDADDPISPWRSRARRCCRPTVAARHSTRKRTDTCAAKAAASIVLKPLSAARS